MSLPLTIHSFLLGHQTEEGKIIYQNPFYNSILDRSAAEMAVMNYGFPVLRNSSRPGLYAITYYCGIRRALVHSLLRQNADLSVDTLSDTHGVYERCRDIYQLLTVVILNTSRVRSAEPVRPSPLVEVAPALLPVLPALLSSGAARATVDEDPSS